jgi:hypothetical protein
MIDHLHQRVTGRAGRSKQYAAIESQSFPELYCSSPSRKSFTYKDKCQEIEDSFWRTVENESAAVLIGANAPASWQVGLIFNRGMTNPLRKSRR